MNKRTVGSQYENIAVEFLISNGYKILERNYRIKQGEIDVIAIKNKCLSFIEVKYRNTLISGFPEEAVNRRKILKICKVAEFYIYSNNIYNDYNISFDVIAIFKDEIKHIKNAFDFTVN